MTTIPPRGADAPPYLTNTTALAWATVSAAARGCDCDAEVTIRRSGDLLMHVQVAHDDGCPALEGRAA